MLFALEEDLLQQIVLGSPCMPARTPQKAAVGSKSGARAARGGICLPQAA